MNVLALETSGRVISIGLRMGTDFIDLSINRGFRHGETLMPAIDTLFNLADAHPSDLDLIACSKGPGSFTALRIGMATAKGLARGAGCPLKAVPTLEILAHGRENWDGYVVPVMDARKKRVYAAAFRKGERIIEDQDSDLHEFLGHLEPGVPVLTTGPDAAIGVEIPNVTVDPLLDSNRSKALIELAKIAFEREGGDPPDLGPMYLRLSEAEEALLKSNGS